MTVVTVPNGQGVGTDSFAAAKRVSGDEEKGYKGYGQWASIDPNGL